MDVLVVIEQPQVSVAPGGAAQVEVRLVNNGPLVEGYDLEVLGEPSSWAQVAPPHVELMPRTDISVSLLFRPPSGPSAPAGRFAYGVKATSTRDGSSSSVEEGHVDVAAEVRLRAELRPSTATAFRSARYRLVVSNDGNAPSRARVRAGDPAEVLKLQVRPETLEVPPGGSATAEIRARARLNFSGSARQHRIQVEHAELPADVPAWVAVPTQPVPAAALTATLSQRRVLGRPVKIAASLAVLAGLAALGAKLLLRAPAAPTQLTASGATDSSVTLQWTGVGGVSKYRLNAYDGDFDAAPALDAKTVEDERAQLSTSFEKLQSGKTYCFTVQAVSGRGARSKPSDKVCQATSGKAGLDPPTNVTASTLDGRSATVTWRHTGGTALGYQILVNGEKKSEIAAGSPLQAVVDIKAGADNRVAVIAVSATDPSLTSPASPAVAVSSGFEVLVVPATDTGRNVQEASAAFPDELVPRKAGGTAVAYYLEKRFLSEEEASAYCTSHGWDPATHPCVAVALASAPSADPTTTR